MKILLTAFKGTSSERLIQCFDSTYDKLVMENDKRKSEQQLIEMLEKSCYDLVLSFGQRPVMKNKLCIETCAMEGERMIGTRVDCSVLMRNFAECGLDVKLSNNAGTSFCNNIYRFGLLSLEKSDTHMVFIHIPFEKNISDFDEFAEKVKNAVSRDL